MTEEIKPLFDDLCGCAVIPMDADKLFRIAKLSERERLRVMKLHYEKFGDFSADADCERCGGWGEWNTRPKENDK